MHRKILELYEAYAQDVFRLAMCYLRNRQDAEDVCQSVFLKLMSKDIPLIPDKEKAWLLTATANACKNHLKSFWRQNVGALEADIPFQEPEHRELWHCIGQLPAKYRACLHLYYYEGYSQEEIAGILKISRTAVQTRMSRARQLLKKELNVNV